MVFTTAHHAFKAGVEVRMNRDTTYWGMSPNGEYDFGGGTAYARRSDLVGKRHAQINPGDPLPDTLSSFLSGSPFVYTVAIAPRFMSSGAHIGPAAVNRNNFNAYAKTPGK